MGEIRVLVNQTLCAVAKRRPTAGAEELAPLFNSDTRRIDDPFRSWNAARFDIPSDFANQRRED
jgi:hypothetical protein